MNVTTPPSRSKRSRAREGSGEEGELRWSTRRSASRVSSYAELSDDDDEDNIKVASGPGVLLDEVESEAEDPSQAEIRCVCGETEDDSERAFVACDTCSVWQHVDCVDYSEDEDEEADKKFYCDRCSPYGVVGATMSSAKQPELVIRSSSNRITPTAGRSKGKTFDAFSYYPRHNDFSVKNSAKRVTFGPDSKAASDSDDDDPDAYNPSEDEAADAEADEDYPIDYDYDDEQEEGSPLFVSPSPAPSNPPSGFQLAKHPRPPNTTPLGDRLVRHWIAGGYADEIDAENNAVDWGSDVSEIDIPDMSEGDDFFAKLAEQDRLIFSMKKKLGQRGERIVSLKQQVLDLERENTMLKGME